MISIIMTTYNKYAYLRCALSYLQNQTQLNKFEVILIIDGSNDNTVDYIKSANFSYSIKYKVIEQGGLANARNEGILLAEGNHLLFMDDDLLLTPDYIDRLTQSLAENPNHVHAGNLKKIHIESVDKIFKSVNSVGDIPRDFLEKSTYIDPIYEPLKIVHRNSSVVNAACWWGIITGGNLCFPRESFEHIGMFDSKFTSWGPEDVDICYRAFLGGYQLKFNSSCVLYHLDHDRDQRKIAGSMVKNALMLYKKYGKPKELLAYLNYFNGTISLKEFNSICCSIFQKDEAQIEDYVLSLKDYINKPQLISWTKNEFN